MIYRNKILKESLIEWICQGDFNLAGVLTYPNQCKYPGYYTNKVNAFLARLKQSLIGKSIFLGSEKEKLKFFYVDEITVQNYLLHHHILLKHSLLADYNHRKLQNIWHKITGGQSKFQEIYNKEGIAKYISKQQIWGEIDNAQSKIFATNLTYRKNS